MEYTRLHSKGTGIKQNGLSLIRPAMIGSELSIPRFKLHLRSKFGKGKKLHPNVPPLPPNKTVVDVFADFLSYLLSCAATYIKDTHPNGVTLWETHRNDIHFVLSHPNGWEGKEQSQMRQAALKAELITDTPEGHGRVSFVTEGEASLHFAIENGVLSQAMEVKKLFGCIKCILRRLFLKRVKALSLLMLAEGRLMLAPTSELLRRGREFSKRLPRHNVRCE